MPDAVIEFNHVWKKFRQGEIHDSLRDLIPAICCSLFGRLKKNSELDKSKKEFWALKDVNFKVEKGEVLGIIGPNGAGKSTILKIISGILRPNKGFVRKNGRLCALIEVGAGFHHDLTGRENIYLNGAILGMTKKEIDEKFGQIVEFSGLKDFIDTPVKRYSTGMLARLGFSVAAHMDPDILLVDEVLSVGDAPFRAKCLRRMSELMQSDVTVIFISHNMELIRQLCSKCLVLSGGTAEFLGDTQKAIDKYMEVLQKGGSSTSCGTREKLRHDIGRILGLKIIDKNGNIVNQVECGDPVTLEIEYELYKPVEELAIEVGFSLSTGLWVTFCDSLRDKKKLPVTMNKNKIFLNIDSMLLSPSDYDITVKMIDSKNFLTIDWHFRYYKIVVIGDIHPSCLIQLNHKWLVGN